MSTTVKENIETTSVEQKIAAFDSPRKNQGGDDNGTEGTSTRGDDTFGTGSGNDNEDNGERLVGMKRIRTRRGDNGNSDDGKGNSDDGKNGGGRSEEMSVLNNNKRSHDSPNGEDGTEGTSTRGRDDTNDDSNKTNDDSNNEDKEARARDDTNDDSNKTNDDSNMDDKEDPSTNKGGDTEAGPSQEHEKNRSSSEDGNENMKSDDSSRGVKEGTIKNGGSRNGTEDPMESGSMRVRSSKRPREEGIPSSVRAVRSRSVCVGGSENGETPERGGNGSSDDGKDNGGPSDEMSVLNNKRSNNSPNGEEGTEGTSNRGQNDTNDDSNNANDDSNNGDDKDPSAKKDEAHLNRKTLVIKESQKTLEKEVKSKPKEKLAKAVGDDDDDDDDMNLSDDDDGSDLGSEDKKSGKAPMNPQAMSRASWVSTVSYEELSKYFHLRIVEAAEKMNICTTWLKRACRAHGINRWPQRKLKAIDRIISSETKKGKDTGHLERAKKKLLKDPMKCSQLRFSAADLPRSRIFMQLADSEEENQYGKMSRYGYPMSGYNQGSMHPMMGQVPYQGNQGSYGQMHGGMSYGYPPNQMHPQMSQYGYGQDVMYQQQPQGPMQPYPMMPMHRGEGPMNPAMGNMNSGNGGMNNGNRGMNNGMNIDPAQSNMMQGAQQKDGGYQRENPMWQNNPNPNMNPGMNPNMNPGMNPIMNPNMNPGMWMGPGPQMQGYPPPNMQGAPPNPGYYGGYPHGMPNPNSGMMPPHSQGFKQNPMMHQRYPYS